MPMDREKHEEILSKLLDSELPTSERTELLQELRVDYQNVTTDFQGLTETKEKLEKDNSDLVLSNSKLFRQIGINSDEGLKEKENEKEFSETVTLESLEGKEE